MRWTMFVLGLVVGCFNPRAQPGAHCGEGNVCPDPLVCVNGVCENDDGNTTDATPQMDAPPDVLEFDAMIDAVTTPADNDGDGVPNTADNCVAMFNTDQHDEDNDSVGDLCDNCPHVANATQTNDLDNDSVGDICDPNPTLGGDSIARFLPMHVAPAQVAESGGWTQGADSRIHATTAKASMVVLGGPWTNTIIEISGKHLVNLVPLVWIGATVGEAATGYYHCGYEEQNDGTPDYHRGMTGHGIADTWDFDAEIDHYNAARLSGAFKIRLTGDATGNTMNCWVSDTRGTVMTGSMAAPLLDPGNAGVRSENISFEVNYIVVFTR
jgi:Thrombospondin type 3 repeat